MSSSITSEPQFQAPDDKNSEISIPQGQPREEPIMAPQTYDDGLWAKRLFDKIGDEQFEINRLDYYGNAIPLGSFCCAIAFIIYGFYRCNVYRVNDTFLWTVILLFGGIGQITAGFLEFAKGRTFPTTVYLCYGFYCLSHYALYVIPKNFILNRNLSMQYDFTSATLCAYYSAWVPIAFAIVLSSVRTNLLYVLHTLLTFAFFLVRAIGEGSDTQGCKRNAAGILEVIAGFFSLLVCLSQIINNETTGTNSFPSFPMVNNNRIDVASPIR